MILFFVCLSRRLAVKPRFRTTRGGNVTVVRTPIGFRGRPDRGGHDELQKHGREVAVSRTGSRALSSSHRFVVFGVDDATFDPIRVQCTCASDQSVRNTTGHTPHAGADNAPERKYGVALHTGRSTKRDDDISNANIFHRAGRAAFAR